MHKVERLSGHNITENAKNTFAAKEVVNDTLLTYLLPFYHRQLGQQQILSISGGLEPVFVRFPMNVPWLSPLPQQYVSMSSLDARVFCVPLFSIRLLLLGWSLDLCVVNDTQETLNAHQKCADDTVLVSEKREGLQGF